MKIATYNGNGVNGRLKVLLRWLNEALPDVVCRQELKAPDNRLPIKEIEKAGYGAIWHGQKSWNGFAILARHKEPILTRRALPGDPDDTHSRYIEASVEGMVVGCLYLPNGNPAPGATELDVYKPARWVDDALFRIEVRKAYRQLLDQGWTDALRKLSANEKIYTFWDYFRDAFRRNAGLRLDHMLLSPSVAKRLNGAGVDKHVRGRQ